MGTQRSFEYPSPSALTVGSTSIHWHGIHMRNNAVNDGANGVTECPIPPGATKTYRFRAEQYGTSWCVLVEPEKSESN